LDNRPPPEYYEINRVSFGSGLDGGLDTHLFDRIPIFFVQLLSELVPIAVVFGVISQIIGDKTADFIVGDVVGCFPLAFAQNNIVAQNLAPLLYCQNLCIK